MITCYSMAGYRNYADIILPLPINKVFTYMVPQVFLEDIQEGKRVIVQFGSRKYYTGIVKNIHHRKPEYNKIKSIIALLDPNPIINQNQFKVWEWMAGYYFCSLGEVFKAALPSGLKVESESKLIANPEFNDVDNLQGIELLIYNMVCERTIVSAKEIFRIFGNKDASASIQNLIDKNALMVQEVMDRGYKPRLSRFLRLKEAYDNPESIHGILHDLKKYPSQHKAVLAYLDLRGDQGGDAGEVEKSLLIDKSGISAPTFNALMDKGYFETTKKKVNRIDQGAEGEGPLKKLSEDQHHCLVQIQSHFKNNDIVLLHGVTSSGKTEIYMHLIREQLSDNRQVLYLLPEIALTSQIINRLREVFGNQVAVYHSRFTDNERVETYYRVSRENAILVVGVRSSIFLPFSNLGLVIVDEEHENTYKQFDPAPRYNARDTAVLLGGLHKADVLLGSATPSLESYYNAFMQKYKLVQLPARYRNIQLPEVVLADLSRARKRKSMHGIFTPELHDAIEDALNKREQVILFQNRRGFAAFIECMDCNYIPECQNCDVTLTYHKAMERLVCHYCGYSRKIPAVCPSCGNNDIETRGFGTEKIEDEIQLIFKEARIARMDLDTTRKKNAYQNIITDFEQNRLDILVGTQMISKGLDFDRVSLVGILNADNLFNFPDFRAFERSYQLISQVSGRAGRKEKQGKVIIQTSNPEHPVIRYVLNNDYERMVHDQLLERRQFDYPPFKRLIKIVLKHKNNRELKKSSLELAGILRNHFSEPVLGPQSPMIGRMQKWYLMQLFMKLDKDKHLPEKKAGLRKIIAGFLTNRGTSDIQIVVDVDPQ